MIKATTRLEITSRVQGADALAPEYPCCCQQHPIKTTWKKGMGKDLVLLTCQNPTCSNAVGVLAYRVDIAKKWETYRKV